MSARERLAAMAPLLESLEQGAPAARAAVRELLAAHQEGLARLLAQVAGAAEAPALLRRLAGDPDIAALLMLHGLHPETVAARVERCVAALAPRLAARGARLELRALDDAGRVHLRLEHGGPPGSLHGEIEEALALAAADAAEVLIEESRVVPLRFAPARGTGGA